MIRGAHSADAPPCGCRHTVGGDEPGESTMVSPSYPQDHSDISDGRDYSELMQVGAWQNVPRYTFGADMPKGVEARGTLQFNGPFLHAWLKFRLPGQTKVHMLQARVDLREVEAQLMQALNESGTTTAAAGGKIWRKMKRGVKKVVNKIAKNKIIKGIVHVAKKVWNNPLVKGIVSATGYGAAIQAAAGAARVAAKAIKGAVKAKKVLSSIAKRAKAGDANALKAARLVKAGMKATGILPPASASAAIQTAAAGGDEGEYLAAVLGACVDCQPSQAPVPYVVGCGADDGGDVTDQEVDALETVATSGAFEGIRWLASRLGPHSMSQSGFTRRDALMSGMQLYAPR